MKRKSEGSVDESCLKKTKSERKFIENDEQIHVSLDILSEFYNIENKTFIKGTRENLRKIVQKYQLENIKEIEGSKLPNHFSISSRRLGNIFRYTLYGLGIKLNEKQSNPLFEENIQTLTNIEMLLKEYIEKSNVSNVIDGLRKVGLKLDHKFEDFQYQAYSLTDVQSDTLKLKTIDNLLFSAIIPPFRNSFEDSEMELTRSCFAPIMGFTSMFSGCSGGSNSSIKDFVHVSGLDDNIQYSIPDFRPDDITLVSFKNNTQKCIRIIREDSTDESKAHTSHKDFIALITQMKIALSHAMRQLIKQDIETWHKQITVLGITTDKVSSHLYSLHCTPILKEDSERILLSDFTLSFIGSYEHNMINERIQLISRIITSLIYPKKDMVTKYLATQHISRVQAQSNHTPNISFPGLAWDLQTINYDPKFIPNKPFFNQKGKYQWRRLFYQVSH